jgi:hypothetical protein
VHLSRRRRALTAGGVEISPEEFRNSLLSNPKHGIAVGSLMVQRSLTEAEAFDALATASGVRTADG